MLTGLAGTSPELPACGERTLVTAVRCPRVLADILPQVLALFPLCQLLAVGVLVCLFLGAGEGKWLAMADPLEELESRVTDVEGRVESHGQTQSVVCAV